MARKALFPFLMAAALAGGYMPGYTQSTGETAGAVHPAILPEDSARAIRRQPPTVEQQAERISRQMQRRLVLDNKQYAKVYKLNLKYLKKLEDSATGWKTSPDRPEGFGGRMGGPHGSGGPGGMGHRDGMPRPGGKDRPGGPGAGRPPMGDKSQMKEKRPHGISFAGLSEQDQAKRENSSGKSYPAVSTPNGSRWNRSTQAKRSTNGSGRVSGRDSDALRNFDSINAL